MLAERFFFFFFLLARLMHSSFSMFPARAKHFLLSMIPAAIVWNHDLVFFFFFCPPELKEFGICFAGLEDFFRFRARIFAL